MDFPAKARSDEEIRRMARELRTYFRLSGPEPVDVLECLRHGEIWTVKGKKRLVFEVRSDREMRVDDAVTSFTDDMIVISAKKSVQDQAFMGVGRARNTLAHELGHAVMHDGAPKARHTAQSGISAPRWLPAFRSAEHHAKVFAAEFLIDSAAARTMATPEEISLSFLVSLESAKISFGEF